MTWQLAIYWAVIALVSGGARWLGASRWLAFAIPIAPLVIWLIYSVVAGGVIGGEGGGMPLWLLVVIYLVLALPPSAVTVFIVPKRNDKPSV